MTYLESYLAGLSQAQLVIYNNIEAYLKNGVENSESALYDLAEKEDSYLNRILSQMKELNSQEIYQRTQEWFALMNEKTQATN